MEAFALAFSAENPHALRNILLVILTILYLIVLIVLFLHLRRANQKVADKMKQLQEEKKAAEASKPTEEEPLMHKLHTVHPRTEETHTDPKAS